MKFLLFVFVSFISFFVQAQQETEENGIDFLIRNQLEMDDPTLRKRVGGTVLFSSVVIQKFYQEREFHPAWLESKKLTERAYEMRYEIQQSKFDGLNPYDYHLDRINYFFDRIEKSRNGGQAITNQEFANIDLLLTDAYIMLSSHLYLGKVDPENLKTAWNIQRTAPELKIDQRLGKALQEGSIRKSLEELYPSFTVYKRMRDGLRELFDYQEKYAQDPSRPWKALKLDKSIKPGDTHNLIPDVRSRLLFWGFLETYGVENERVYDSVMVAGVKKLQYRHGMEQDGVIGQGTIQAINQTPENLIATASVNMERLRWLPDSLKENELILVNTANFQLDFISRRDTLLSSKVIVGKSIHSTPQFSAMMSYIVFSPTWTVPNSIARNEIIPAVKRNHNYLKQNNMKILTASGVEVPSSSIDWAKVNPRTFPYIIRQEPGENNALGLVKFMFPNKHSVYIHDTPARSLFDREDRALSHGCIRIQKPFEFAKLLLSFDPSWTDEKIRENMHLPKEKIVMLDRKIPVVVLYLTYWANNKGDYFFRRDIYSRDAEIYKSLREGRISKSGV
ncbi:L,D-transpeptidase family protein [Cecembia calidifontis]|uniref:Murein L,D-transpeptidase YcbB/YkuD n=1 Tax=Cecembia calidifontis TaxID=1187080 RepID=A0A4Q7P7L3_9BACT|nr:L,D-transpeptidase family protein [Cecembia calidifontis]RZS96133.1 murein L,D-transpeptidase YcbB/YkuD [Cecembia calidifontis]